jgi:hypothetical protein
MPEGVLHPFLQEPVWMPEALLHQQKRRLSPP